MSRGKCKPSKLSVVWYNMRRRCLCKSCPTYKDYGGRGITICKEWDSRKSFEEWAVSHGYREGLQIDRIDNNGPYAPWNCRFVTSKVNCNNRRNPNVVSGLKAKASKPIVYCGEETTIAELSRRYGIPYSTIKNREKTGRDLLTGR